MSTSTTAVPGTEPTAGDGQVSWRPPLPDVWPLVAVIAVLGAAGSVTTASFLTPGNVRAVLISASIIGIVAVGMTFLTLSGNLVSLGLQQTTVMAGLLYLALVGRDTPWVAATLVTVVIVVLIGVVQALMVLAGINAVVTTLSTGAVLFGAMAAGSHGQVVTAGGADTGWPGNGSAFGVPAAVLAFIAFAVVAELVSRTTVLGRQTRLMGANRDTAKLTGISELRVLLFVFVALSVASAAAGVLASARIGQATSNDLGTLSFDVIAAVLVGGTAIAGGSGSPMRSALGAVVIAMLTNLMVLNNVTTGYRLLTTGLVVLGAVVVLHLLRRGRAA